MFFGKGIQRIVRWFEFVRTRPMYVGWRHRHPLFLSFDTAVSIVNHQSINADCQRNSPQFTTLLC